MVKKVKRRDYRHPPRAPKNINAHFTQDYNCSVKGLRNLGNTCYLNSSVQCLCHSPYLLECLSSPIKFATLQKPHELSVDTLEITLPTTVSSVTSQFMETCKNMKEPQNLKKASNAMNPISLRDSVVEKYPRFGGFGQQDSHEFLRALLDCLKQEELIRWHQGIVDQLHLDIKSAAPEDRQLVHSWRKTASVATLVDRLFGGIIVSSLQCSTCNATRIGFEPFLDLSLPIPDGVVSANSGVHSGPSVARETKKSKQEVKRERKRKKKNFRRESFRTPRPEEDIHSDPPASPDRVISDLDTADPRDSDSSISFVPRDSPIPPTNTTIDYTPSPQNSPQLDNIDDSSCVGSDNENGPLHSESLSSLSSKHHSPAKTSGSDERNGLSDYTTESVPVHQLSKLTLTPTQPDLFDSDELTQAIRFSQIPLRSCKATSSIASDVVTLEACLAKFTAPEHLTDLSRSVCEACCAGNKTADRAGVIHNKPSQVMDLKNVVRRDMILEPPFLLTIHFKRFQQSENRLRKSQRHALFPILLDLSPYCSALYLSPVDSMLYRLYGVVEHMGSMTRGHYVAYVAASPDGPEVTNGGDSLRLQPDMQRILNMLHRPVKWPLTPHDLVQRLRICDREQLLESFARSSSLPFSDSESTFDPNLNPPDGGANLDDRPWYRCSDDQVTKVPLSDVLNCQAFLLFYERIAT